MRRLLALLPVLLMLLGALGGVARADELMLDRPDEADAYEAEPLYDDARFEPWAYTFEGQQSNSAGYIPLYFWMNQILVAKAWMLKMALRVTEYALLGDFFEPFSDRSEELLGEWGYQLWEVAETPLVMGALALAGLWALWLYLRGRTGRVWGIVGSTVLVVMLTTVLLSTGVDSALTGVGLARGLAVQVYGWADDLVYSSASGQGLLQQSGDAAWRALVYEPWLTGELSPAGRTFYRSSDGLDGGAFLARTITQRHNECLFNTSQGNLYCPWWAVEFLPRRMLLAIWTLLTTLFYAGALVALGGGIILAQLTLLLFIALSPVWLLLALWWPEGGIRLVGRWVVRALGALAGQALLAATLAALMMLTLGVESLFASTGWMIQSVLLAALAALAFRYRYGWLAPAVALSSYRERLAAGGASSERPWLPGRRSPAVRPGRGEEAASGRTEQPPAYGSLLMAPPAGEPLTANAAMERTDLRAVAAPPLSQFQSQMQAVREQLVRDRVHEREVIVHPESPASAAVIERQAAAQTTRPPSQTPAQQAAPQGSRSAAPRSSRSTSSYQPPRRPGT